MEPINFSLVETEAPSKHPELSAFLAAHGFGSHAEAIKWTADYLAEHPEFDAPPGGIPDELTGRLYARRRAELAAEAGTQEREAAQTP